jgi:hypothetical protein
MKTTFGFIDPGAIMGVVVALIILAVGIFAFFITIQNIPNQDANHLDSWNAINNTTSVATQVFNIIGVVMIIGAIMAIVGLVYNYVR